MRGGVKTNKLLLMHFIGFMGWVCECFIEYFMCGLRIMSRIMKILILLLKNFCVILSVISLSLLKCIVGHKNQFS